ncbi:sugar ABC transporter ATP-binding protein [Aminipila sp.]|jgi:ribose transport system ATP-binding protein|uniref:sugar ABC transporter ATP-binding protein n=1 Tax=Aminipila sp. TaxID=2060095 RepID=UPI001DA342E1|nr:ATP-binding cassette domain-containing protein [Aminipila sp.]MBE6035237.1 ATP-binding cassette domain-containing protein [Clostridiales bacterium]
MHKKIVTMSHITKAFSGVTVLNNVDFNIYEGRIMALLGENGAGKSTLMKILTGVYEKTSGEVFLNGESVHFRDTKESQEKGIAIIHQELNLIGHLSIGENIFLGREPINRFGKIDWKRLYQESEKWIAMLGLHESPKVIVNELSVGKQQLVEIAKALSLDAKILIMDEPTGALTISETEKLFSVIRKLKEQNHSIVYISHRLEEIFKICDDITVLRDGGLIGEVPVNEVNEEKLIEMMVGRRLEEQYPKADGEIGNTILEVKGLDNPFVKNASFILKKGETLGIAGLMGSGRTELARTIYGIYKMDKGEIFINGSKIHIKNPRDAIKAGITYVSEDRKANGIVLGMSIKENITLASLKRLSGILGHVYRGREEEVTEEYMNSLSIKASSSKQLVKYLSGGNQQKVSIAKNLFSEPSILILDEPTRGVDVGAKKEIYNLINKFKKAGMSIIMISSEIPEILGLSDRVLVMHEGCVSGVLDVEDANQENIMSLAVGKGV